VLWRCWLDGRKGVRPIKNWVVACWHGCLSGVRCRLACSPADASATHYLLLQYLQIGFTFLVPAHLGSPRQGAIKRVCVCVCVIVLFFGWWMHTFVVLGWVFFIPEKETGFGKCLRNDLFCAEWDIKPQLSQSVSHRVRTTQPKLRAWSGWHMTDGNELWRPGNSCRETRSVMFSHKTAVSAKFIFSSKLAVTRMKCDDGTLFMCIDRYLLFYHKQILEYEWGRYVNIHESFRILLLLPRQL